MEAAERRVSELKIDRSRRLPSRRRTRRLIIGLGVLLLLALAAVALLWRPPVVQVAQVREARPGEEQTAIAAAGYVAAQRRSVIAPKVAGRLDALLVAEGDRVQEGQVIARLDDEEAQVAYRQVQANARAAEAELSVTRAQAGLARRQLERQRQLFEGGAAPRSTLQDARAASRAADARVEAAAAQALQAARAVDAARLGVENTVVRAPFAGTVVRKLADEGAVLAPAAIVEAEVGGIVELVDLGSLEVEAEVSEDQLARIRPGQPALVFLDAWPGRALRAVTGTVRPAIDRAKGTAVVKVHFRDPPQGALPDMAAKVSFLREELPPAALSGGPRLRVPASAVVQRDGGAAVFVVEGERVRSQPVRVARRLGDEVALTQGPEAGTAIVAAPGDRLRDGGRVRVRSEGS